MTIEPKFHPAAASKNPTHSFSGGTPAQCITLGKVVAMILGTVATVAPTTEASAQNNEASTQAEASGGIQEVIVTARRREESLQEVPLTVAAFNGDDLEARNVSNVQDLALLVPNMIITGGGTAAGTSNGEWRVRGVPGVARYIDGIYIGTTRASLQSVVELERVEVLRGPQGTLFGKGAIGGAVNFITKDPAPVFGARVNVAVGSHDRFDVVANVDVPLSDTVLTKLTGISLRRQGYVDSVTSDRSYGGQTEHQLRGTMLWTPIEDLRVRASASFLDITDDGDPNVLWAVHPEIGADGYPNDTYLVNWLIETGRLTGTPLTNDTLPGEYRNRSTQLVPSFEHEEFQFTTDVTYDISDSLSLKFLGGYKEFEGSQFSDADASEHILFDNWTAVDREEISAELQLSGSGDRYNWVLGYFYTESESWSLISRWENIEALKPANLAAIRARWPGIRINSPLNRLSNPSDSSQAVFGEGTYNITEGLALTLGLRYSMDEVHPLTLIPCTQPPAYMNLSRDYSACGIQFAESAEFSKMTPRISLKYQWNPLLMTYITYSQGFDGGGINTTADRRVPPQLPNGGFFPYDPQLFTNYELGVRSDLLDGRLRLNSSLFFGEWTDMHVNEELIPGQSGRWISNAGEAEVKGVEVEGITQIGDALQLNFAAAWLDTGYTNLGTAQNITLDTRFPFSPEWSFSLGGQYDMTVGSGANLRFRADYGWIDETRTNQDILTSIDRPAYGLLSAGVTYRSVSRRWEVTLSGTNLTDEYYRTSGFLLPVKNLDFGTAAPPREFAVSFRYTLE